jgi:hypothetical protein
MSLLLIYEVSPFSRLLKRNTLTHLISPIRSSYLFFGRHTYTYMYTLVTFPVRMQKATTRTLSPFLSLYSSSSSSSFFPLNVWCQSNICVLNVCIGEWSKENLLACVYHTLSRLDALMLMRKEEKKDEGKRA